VKILHCCLAGPYTENFGYQENIITNMHKLQGYDVFIITSDRTWQDGKKIVITEKKSFVTNEGIPVTRLSFVKWLPVFLVNKLRIFKGITEYLIELKPDIIFIHGVQFLSILKFVKYIKQRDNIKVYVDNHADYFNSAKNWLSKYILHKIIYKYCAKSIEPYTIKFYGTLPNRVKFLQNMYNINKNKIELLLMGYDDTLIDFNDKDNIRTSIRNKYNIQPNNFLIITGGKINKLKNIHLLVKAFNELNLINSKLIIFGSLHDDIKEEIEKIIMQSNNIKFINWKSSKEIYELFLASDLAVFPGGHSVLWEQAVGLGLPCIFKGYDGHKHVDIGGNCIFISDVNISTIKEALLLVINNKDFYQKMKYAADSENGKNKFSYYNIAKQAIGCITDNNKNETNN